MTILNILDEIEELAKELNARKKHQSNIVSDVLKRRCSICREVKFKESFSKDASRKGGLSHRCKDCYSKYHSSNSEWCNERRQIHHEKHRITARIRGREWALDNPNIVRNKNLARYGLTVDSFDDLVNSQNGLCKICKNELVAGKHTHVDHCHNSGKVRGILCQTCNTKLGWYEKNAKEVEEYLKNSGVN